MPRAGSPTCSTVTSCCPGDYQLLFDVASYRGEDSFFQGCAVGLRIDDAERGYHVPLLLAPFGLTTYRGS